jgi:hypothetical protein
MKMSDVHVLKWSFPLAAGLLLATGCAHAIRLKVVDAVTSQPLAGVSTVWHEKAYNLLTGRLYQTGPTNLPPSGRDGVITIGGVHKQWSNNLIFSRPGYTTLYGNYNDARLWWTERMTPFPRGGFKLEKPFTEAVSSNGYLIIRMQK